MWATSTFTHRDRRLTESLAREFFSRVVVRGAGGLRADVRRALQRGRHAHRGVGLAQKASSPRTAAGRTAGLAATRRLTLKGEKRGNATHESGTTDPEARLYQKAEGQAATLCYMAHGLMENRNGLSVERRGGVTLATGTAGAGGGTGR